MEAVSGPIAVGNGQEIQTVGAEDEEKRKVDPSVASGMDGSGNQKSPCHRKNDLETLRPVD